MIIRWGNYTVYKGVELVLKELRQEAPVADTEKQYFICYRNEEYSGQFADFTQMFSEDEFCKVVTFSELDNAFWISTYGLYQGNQVMVFEYKADPQLVYVTTDDPQVAVSNNFLEMDGHYGKDIPLKELEKLWEERTSAELALPLPIDLKSKRDMVL